MILVEKRNDGIISNIPASAHASFTMAFDAKMFATLSDSLYQNKPGSIIREVSCNALDSHVEAGKADIPFQIHLPSLIEPYLSIRDFGIGMDHETVTKIFTCIGKSTKELSNNSVGAFGLGSKTPFSYTDMFTVIAIKDGISRTYTMYKDEEGMPMLSLMGGENPTNEGNGVEVIIPINNTNDRTMFAREIAQQLHFFPVRPTIIGGDHAVSWANEPTDADVLVHQNNVKTFKNGQYRKGCIVVMGPVGYELNFELLKSKMPNHGKVLSWLAGKTARIYFNIGDISVTPSRENLSYDNKTLKALAESFDGYVDEVSRVFNDRISTFVSPFERAKFIYESNDEIGNIITISSKDNDSVLHYTGRFAYFDPQTIMAAMGDKACMVEIRNTVNCVSNKKLTISRVSINELINSNLTVYIEDSCKSAKRRYAALNESSRSTTIYTVIPQDLTKAKYVYEAFVKSGIDVKYLSEVTPTKNLRDYSFVKSHGYVLSLAAITDSNYLNIGKTRNSTWERITDKAEIEPAFYVSSDHGGVFGVDAIIKYQKLLALGIIPESYKLDVYAFPVKTADALASDDEWISLTSYIKDNFNDAAIKLRYREVWESAMYLRAFESLRNSIGVDLTLFSKIKELKDWTVDLELTLFDKTELANSYDKRILSLVCDQMPSRYSYTGKLIIEEYIQGIVTKAKAQIPLLPVLSYNARYNNYNDKDRAAVLEYIEMYTERHGPIKIEPIDIAELEKRLLTCLN